MKTRKFDPNFYDCVSIPCTTAAYDRALAYCLLRSNEMQRFSLSMMLSTKIAPLRFASSGTFCSKVCAEALQEAQVLSLDINASRITPSGLHATLTQDSCTMHQGGPIEALDFAV
jgi:hypothetical protein